MVAQRLLAWGYMDTFKIGLVLSSACLLGAAGLGIAFHAKPVVASSADHAISELGLDGVLYLIGFTDRDIGEGPG